MKGLGLWFLLAIPSTYTNSLVCPYFCPLRRVSYVHPFLGPHARPVHHTFCRSIAYSSDNVQALVWVTYDGWTEDPGCGVLTKLNSPSHPMLIIRLPNAYLIHHLDPSPPIISRVNPPYASCALRPRPLPLCFPRSTVLPRHWLK